MTRNVRREILLLNISRIIHAGLYLVLLTPLLVWSGFLYPQLTAKVTGFQSLMELILAALSILLILRKRGNGNIANPLDSPLIVILAVCFAYSLLSSAFGTDLNRSFWGINSRQDGLVLWAHFLAWTLVIVWVCRNGPCLSSPLPPHYSEVHRRIRSYIYFSFWVSIAIALTALGDVEIKPAGILQSYFGPLDFDHRISGVFGNPMFLGSYLLFHFFFGCYFLLERVGPGAACAEVSKPRTTSWRRRVVRYTQAPAAAIGLGIIAITILAGQTRGVIFALIAGAASIAALSALRRPAGKVTKIAGALVVVSVILTASIIWPRRNNPVISQIPIIQRLTHLSAAENATTAERLLSWGSGLRGALAHPLLGWGHNNVYYALSEYYDPQQIKINPVFDATQVRWFDKSHNFFIDLLVERGVIGLLLYLILLAIIARSLWRLVDRRLAICLTGALISYLISNSLAFDNFGSLFGFSLAIACVASLSSPGPVRGIHRLAPRKRDDSRVANKGSDRAAIWPRVKILGVILLLVLGLYVQIEIAIANHQYSRARAEFPHDPQAGITQYVDAFEHYSPYAGKEKITCISFIINSVIARRQSFQQFDVNELMLRWTNEAVAAHPKDGATYVAFNHIYNNAAFYFNPEFGVTAKSFGQKALALLPNFQPAMYNLGRTYLVLNEPDRAVELNRRMLRDVDVAAGHWFLGLSLLMNDQKEEAKSEIRKAMKMGFQPQGNDFVDLRILLTEKDISELTAGK